MEIMNETNGDIPVLENVEQVADGWLKKYILTYRMPDGSKYEYEAISRKGLNEYRAELESAADYSKGITQIKPDAGCIVPILPDGSVLLIREFRYAINDWIIAFPAGLVEAGEDIATNINRELYEETGYKLRSDVPDPITLLPQTGYSSVGMTSENVMVAKALVEPDGEQNLERGEFIELFTLAPDEIDDFLDTNTMKIGTRCQLVLECMCKNNAFSLRKRKRKIANLASRLTARALLHNRLSHKPNISTRAQWW